MGVDIKPNGIRKGYLNNDFRFFHLKDQKGMEFESHYHDFYKIVIFISGKVTYLIEGKAYELNPYDILFINRNDIHKSEIAGSEIYERIILWMNSEFLDIESSESSKLKKCFQITSESKSKLMRLKKGDLAALKESLAKLESTCSSAAFGSDVLMKALFIELLIYLNRYCLSQENINITSGVSFDETISSILDYINDNLSEDLSLDMVASKFYLNKYYLMHRFKNQTGYSLHSYILKKRLMKANLLMKGGCSVGDVCAQCGFGDYSNFIRAYKKMYGMPPKKHCSN